MAKKAKQRNILEKFIILFIALVAGIVTFGTTSIKPNNNVAITDQPQTKAANTYIMTEIDYDIDAPFKNTNVNDNTLTKGTSIITTKGVKGKRNVTYKVIYEDDIIVAKEVVSEEITKKPVDQVTHVGTYVAPANTTNKVLGSHTNSTPKTDPTPNPTPDPQPPHNCPGGYWVEAFSHCAPINSSGVKATALCKQQVNGMDKYSFNGNQNLACGGQANIKEWYGI